MVQLVSEPGDEVGGIRYATVSHCWGDTKPLTLNSASLTALTAGIHVSELPLNLREAVQTSQRLGFYFVWIDSLCILQDSIEDWANQAPQMSMVYRNGSINIAMSAAANTDLSCFAERDLSQTKPMIVLSEWDDHAHGRFHMYSEYMYHDIMDCAPLSARAWVVQETLLPSRIVYLTGNQLLWKCSELVACETYPSGFPSRVYMDDIERRGMHSVLKSTSEQTTAGARRELCRRTWGEIVRTYTKRHLSVPSDRLIAIAGVARTLGEVAGDDYCAGLWRTEIVLQLYWSRLPWTTPPTRPPEYRAPSWSWASVDDECILPHYHTALDICAVAQVVACDVETFTRDPYGIVTRGELKLRGRLVTMQLEPEHSRMDLEKVFFDNRWHAQVEGQDITVDLDCPLSQLRLHCMPIVHVDDRSICCLLLVPTGHGKGQFQRVGIQWFGWREPTQPELTIFDDVVNEDWLEYEEKGEDGLYTVTVV